MKPTESDLTMSMSERRPSASRMPSGSEKAMPVMPMVIDSMKPPKSLEATGVSAERQDRGEHAGDRADEVEPPEDGGEHRGERGEEAVAGGGDDAVDEVADEEAGVDDDRHPERAAPEQPVADAGEGDREPEELARQLGDEDRRQRDEEQDEGERRPPVHGVGVEAEEELLPALADDREAGAARRPRPRSP